MRRLVLCLALLAFAAAPAVAQVSPYTTTQDAATVIDNRIGNSTEQNSNRDALTTFAVGLTGAPITFRSVLNWSVVIADEVFDVIDSAKVTITASVEAMSAGDSVDVHVLTQTPSETQSTWNIYSTGNAWASPGGDYNATRIARFDGNVTGDITFRVDSWVQGLVDGNTQHGLLLKRASESGARNITFHSDKAADTGNFAQLVVWSHASPVAVGPKRIGYSRAIFGINTDGVGISQP